MLPSAAVMLVLLSYTYGENPAIQVILTNKGLQYGVHEVTGLIQEKLESITFPDISGSVDILIGHVSYTLSGVTIKKCDLPEPTVKFNEEHTGLYVSISGFSVALTGDWSTRFGVIHDGGSFDMAIFNIAMTSALGLGRDAEGHLSVTDVSCDAQVGDLNVRFYGGASWFIQKFVDHFKGDFMDRIKSTICPFFEKSIDMFERHLQAMNVSFDVDQVLTLDVPLTGSPIITASSMNLGLKGEFYSIKTHEEPPFVAQPFTVPEHPDYMLSVGLSDFTLNSASYGFFSAGELQILINDSMIPPACPLRLNTSSMGMFVPTLPKQFPGLLMELLVQATEAPRFSLQPGAIHLDAQAAVKAFATEPNGTQIPLFKLSVASKFSGKVWISGDTLGGSVMMDNVTLTLVSSEVGTVKIDALENIVRAGMKAEILPKVNEKLEKGILLPRLKNVKLINSVLETETGFIAVSSDAQILRTEDDFH